MTEIKCPKCGEIFHIDESDYDKIARQVKDAEFEKAVADKLTLIEERAKEDLKISKMEDERKTQQILKEKEDELTAFRMQIEKLKQEVASNEDKLKLAVLQANVAKDGELAETKEKVAKLTSEMEVRDAKNAAETAAMKESYEKQLKAKDETVAYYKDFKARQSTKMVGESLEVHCMTEFNKLRMTAFPGAYFEKDNDAKSGSKGDFIFRETTPDGAELISIMFEMKNENEETASKHKNEDFFEKLDRDRTEKKCEYAVLVSLLELDNDYYNEGIVDVSYRYEKMYVIRPQFFIPLISLLRNAAKGALEYKRELIAVKNQEIDISRFESNMADFKDKIAKNVNQASAKFQDAIADIDKAINALQKTKDALLSSDRNLRLANDKAEDLSIKKLTRGAPAVAQMFEDLHREEQ